MFAILVLAAFWLWDQVETILFNRRLTSYKPIPILFDCSYSSRQVTVLLCTLDTLLVRCLRTWLANNPLEVIIVTIPQHLDHIRSTVSKAELSSSDLAKITILSSPIKGKRAQMSVGIQAARGQILANVDDHITWHPDFLKGMLPCLEDEKVGAVGPAIEAIIPEDRRHPEIITPYEIAAMRVVWNRNPRAEVAYVAGRWCWGLTGVSYLIRASILRDLDFLEGFKNDSWRGNKLDVGEDTFVTRWLQSHDWVIALQSLSPETEVYRTVKTTSDFFKQMFRWERSTIQSHIRQAHLKQIYRNRFVARKTWGRLLRPLITTARIITWVSSMRSHIALSLLVVALYANGAYTSYKAFFEKHPYMRRYWWAAVGQDFFYIVQDYWCWCTLSNTSWESRQVSAEEQNKID